MGAESSVRLCVRGNGSGSFRARDIVAKAEVCRNDDARGARAHRVDFAAGSVGATSALTGRTCQIVLARLPWNEVSRRISPTRQPCSSTEASAFSRQVRRGVLACGGREQRGLPAFSGPAPSPSRLVRSSSRRPWPAKLLTPAGDCRSLVAPRFTLASSTRSKHVCSRA